MKTGKPSGTDVKNAASVTGGVLVGSYVSNTAFAALHDEKKVIADPEEKKKHDNMGLLKRGGFVLAGGLAASAIKSNDVLSLMAKGLCYGIAGQQAYEIVKSFGSKSDAVQKMAASSNKAERAIAAGFGLGCACNDSQTHYAQLNGRRRKRGGMGIVMPAIATDYAPVGRFGSQANALETAISQGRTATSN